MKNITATQIMQAIKTAEDSASLYSLPSELITDSDIVEMLKICEKPSELMENLTDYFENSQGLFNVEIIYHSEAMKYLRENDQSLINSLALAAGYGYNLKNLNSEILASLLATEKNREAFYSEFMPVLESEIENLNLNFGGEDEKI